MADSAEKNRRTRAAAMQLQEALALPEEPATLAPKQGRRDLKMLLPIARRLTELTVEADGAENGPFVDDFADMFIAAALLVSRNRAVAEDGEAALQQMAREAALGPLADWVLDKLQPWTNKNLTTTQAVAAASFVMRLLMVRPEGSVLGFLSWPRGPGGPFDHEGSLEPKFQHAAMAELLMSSNCEDESYDWFRANRQTEVLVVATDPEAHAVLRKCCLYFICMFDMGMFNLAHMQHVLEDNRWLETLVALADPRPSSGADDMCTSSLFSWNVHCLRTIVLELMPTRNQSQAAQLPEMLAKACSNIAETGALDFLFRWLRSFNTLEVAENASIMYPFSMTAFQVSVQPPRNLRLSKSSS